MSLFLGTLNYNFGTYYTSQKPTKIKEYGQQICIIFSVVFTSPKLVGASHSSAVFITECHI